MSWQKQTKQRTNLNNSIQKQNTENKRLKTQTTSVVISSALDGSQILIHMWHLYFCWNKFRIREAIRVNFRNLLVLRIGAIEPYNYR